ncbi:MAG: hypothetical protein NT038_00165 [Euryarchaeota archaeon]|nr:hypothetical protein [Euryarchaeota archaeon]
MTENDVTFFCERCGTQLSAVDDIHICLCQTCQKKRQETKHSDESFVCEICGKQLHAMGEISQGICNVCKGEIIKKIR